MQGLCRHADEKVCSYILFPIDYSSLVTCWIGYKFTCVHFICQWIEVLLLIDCLCAQASEVLFGRDCQKYDVSSAEFQVDTTATFHKVLYEIEVFIVRL